VYDKLSKKGFTRDDATAILNFADGVRTDVFSMNTIPSINVTNKLAEKYGIPNQADDGSVKPDEEAVERKKEKSEEELNQRPVDPQQEREAFERLYNEQYPKSDDEDSLPSQLTDVERGMKNLIKLRDLWIKPGVAHTIAYKYPKLWNMLESREEENEMDYDNPESIFKFLENRGKGDDIPQQGKISSDDAEVLLKEIGTYVVPDSVEGLEDLEVQGKTGNGKYSKGTAIRDTLTKMGVDSASQKVFLTKSGLFKKHIDSEKADKVPKDVLEKVLALHGYSISYPTRKLTYKLVAKNIGL
jgi:hypothetical protein